ncbi:unnamed protein product [Sympodiomycopsis kandeliae]
MRRHPSAAGSSMTSRDTTSSNEGHRTFSYRKSTSWYYSDATLDSPASPDIMQTLANPRKLSTSASARSLRGNAIRTPYKHSRGQSDSTGAVPVMTAMSDWESTTSARPNARARPMSTQERNISRQVSESRGRDISQQVSKSQQHSISSEVSQSQERNATLDTSGTPISRTPSFRSASYLVDSPLLEHDTVSNPSAPSYSSREVRAPLIAVDEPSSAGPIASQSDPTIGQPEGLASQNQLPSHHASEEEDVRGHSNPDVPRSAISTPTQETAALRSFGISTVASPSVDLGNEREVMRTASIDDTPAGVERPTTAEISAAADSIDSIHDMFSPLDIDHQALETLAEVSSVRSGSVEANVLPPAGTSRASDVITSQWPSTVQSSQRSRRQLSNSSDTSYTSLPMGFGQSLRGYFAEYLRAGDHRQEDTGRQEDTAAQEWIASPSAPSRAGDFPASVGSRRSSTTASTGYNENPGPDSRVREIWQAHQGSSSIASGVLPFPTDVGSSEGGHGQRIHRDDREYLSGLAHQLQHSTSIEHMRESSDDTQQPMHTSGSRRQRSSDPLIASSLSSIFQVDHAGTDDRATTGDVSNVRSSSRLSKRGKRWSDVMRDAAANALWSSERRGSASTTADAAVMSGRSSRVSRSSVNSLMPGAMQRRFARRSAEINTRDESSPLSFFGNPRDRQLLPSAGVLANAATAANGHDYSFEDANEPPAEHVAPQERFSSSPHSRGGDTVRGGQFHRLAPTSTEGQGRRTMDTIRDVRHRLSMSNNDREKAQTLQLATMLQFDPNDAAFDTRFGRLLALHILLRITVRALCILGEVIVPVLWYIFEGRYLYEKLSPAVLFAPLLPVILAWTSVLALLWRNPGYVTMNSDPDPEKQIKEKHRTGDPQNDPRNEVVDDEDPAIAALDKDSPRRKMALAKLRAQLMKATATPSLDDTEVAAFEVRHVEEEQQEETAAHRHVDMAAPVKDSIAASAPSSPSQLPPEVASQVRGKSSRRIPAISFSSLNPAPGATAPPTSPIDELRASPWRLGRRSRSLKGLRSNPAAREPAASATNAVGTPTTEAGKFALPRVAPFNGATTVAEDGPDNRSRRHRTLSVARETPAANNATILDCLFNADAIYSPRKLKMIDTHGQASISISVRWCPRCKSFPPPRSVHSWMSNRCVLDFQYHAYWLGRDVGRGNILLVVVHLLTCLITAVYIMAFSAWMVADLSGWNQQSSPPGILFSTGPYGSFGSALKAAPFAGILFLICLLFSIVVFIPQLVLHLLLASKAQTLPQRRMSRAIIKEVQRQQQSGHGIDEDVTQMKKLSNPFDTGNPWSNIRNQWWSTVRHHDSCRNDEEVAIGQ